MYRSCSEQTRTAFLIFAEVSKFKAMIQVLKPLAINLQPGEVMEKKITITLAKPEDAGFIVNLARQTFEETYSEFNDPLNMELYVNESFTEQVIRKELEALQTRFYIAYLDGKPVGFCTLRDSRKAKSLEEIRTLEVQRIYVLNEYQGSHVGKALMEKIKALAKEENYPVIWLQVWQQNQKAIRFYQKAGFVVFETACFQLGNEVQQDYLMRYDLYL